MKKFNRKSSAISVIILAVIFSFALIAGCDDAGVENPTTINNPNVKSYDSLWVEEDSTGFSKFSAIDLLNGINVLTLSSSRDVGLAGGTDSTGSNFFIRSGILDDLRDAGYESRWFRVAENYSAAKFDTMSAVYTNIGSSFGTEDFTQESTEFWEYFNTPMNLADSHSVFCFWLKGRKDAGQNNNINVFGILQPREASDFLPGSPYGFSMSFRVRINTNGENDFRKTIPAQ